jgi:triosephosphate isomerase
MKLVVANWKMNHLRQDALAFCREFLAGYRPAPGVTAAVAPPFTLLETVGRELGDRVQVYGQNAHAEPKGAFTGEVSMPQLRDAGATGVLLGHSERRQYFGETEATLLPKLRAARTHGLLPMLCVGETLAQRDAVATLEVLGRQLAILGEAHGFIRAELVGLLGAAGADVPILYGGSVTPDSFPEILGIPEVAGGLVGGASLEAGKFLKLVGQAQGR